MDGVHIACSGPLPQDHTILCRNLSYFALLSAVFVLNSSFFFLIVIHLFNNQSCSRSYDWASLLVFNIHYVPARLPLAILYRNPGKMWPSTPSQAEQIVYMDGIE